MHVQLCTADDAGPDSVPPYLAAGEDLGSRGRVINLPTTKFSSIATSSSNQEQAPTYAEAGYIQL
eukprot:SAG11_NODE_647_length_7957_cov_2.900903_6_plen_65_part_00